MRSILNSSGVALVAILVLQCPCGGTLAQPIKIPPEACEKKLKAFMDGQTQDAAADVEYFRKYCEKDVSDQAANAYADYVLDNALDAAKGAGAQYGAWARDQIRMIHGQAPVDPANAASPSDTGEP